MSDSTVSGVTTFELSINLSPVSGLTEEALSNRELLLRTYRAIEQGDQAALVAILDPDVRFFEAESLPYGVSARGIEAALAGVSAMLAAWQHIRVEIEEFATAGDLVIAYMTFSAVSRDSGRRYAGPCAEIFRFHAGRVIEWRPIYWDTHAARAACLTMQPGDSELR